MRKKILALVCATVMTLAMGMTVCAAPSVTSDSLSTSTQQFDEATIKEFATTTTVKSGNGTISAASVETAAEAIAQAKAVVNDNAFVAAVVELDGEAGTFTLGCPNVWAGQKVVILHKKADGTWETIKPDSVANNSVTFTLSSLSPVAIVVDTTASKTGDMVNVVTLMALASIAGAAVCVKRAKAY